MLTVAESAAILGVSPARVRALIAAGLLPARKVGRAWILQERDVESRLDARPRAGRPRHDSNAYPESTDDPAAVRPRNKNAATHRLYRACKAELSACPSMAEIQSIEDPDEQAFRIAIADFFLQRKQRDLVRQGVF